MPSVSAVAQYQFDPSNADEQRPPDVRVFGVVRDDRNRFVENATVLVEQPALTYVQTTNVSGRYTVSFPIDITLDLIRVSCAKPGFEFARLTRQSGGTDKRKWVEVNCILRPSSK